MFRRLRTFAILLSAPLAVAMLAGGCTPAQYASQADHDAYRAVRDARQEVLGQGGSFDITYLPLGAGRAASSITVGDRTIDLLSAKPQKITLDESLQIAFRNCRSFQDAKEDLYVRALAVTSSQRGWGWPPLFGGDATASVNRTAVNEDGSVNAAAAHVGPTLTEKLRNGGLLTLGYSLDLASNLTGWKNTNVGSLMNANFTQPLLRGAWDDLAYEPQYRLERNFVFAVYGYERFTQTFAAGVVTQYYAVLSQQDQLQNDVGNIARLKETAALTKVLVEGGQASRIEQDQADQNVLNAEVRYQQDQQTYRNMLDNFKLLIGLPIVSTVELDYPGALEALGKTGPLPEPLDEQAATTAALRTRPDVLVAASQLRDANRNVEIAANNFLPQLDAQLGISAPGTPPREFARTQFNRNIRSAGMTFDYNLDQTDNRNAYRVALVAQQKAQRDLDELLDTVRLQVRQAYRGLEQSRTSYKLQVRSVEIAKRRQKLAALQQKEGQASARDVLEAEEDLRSAQNGMTSALTEYTTTRLTFLATLGMLWIDDKGLIHERSKPFEFDAILRCYPYADGR